MCVFFNMCCRLTFHNAPAFNKALIRTCRAAGFIARSGILPLDVRTSIGVSAQVKNKRMQHVARSSLSTWNVAGLINCRYKRLTSAAMTILSSTVLGR